MCQNLTNMKPIYIKLCNLNQIREDFILDFYRALSGKSKALLPKDIWRAEASLFNLTEAGQALITKVHHMIYEADLATMLRMLYSFRFGVKRLKSFPGGVGTYPDQLYEYTDKDGNEKYSHKGNLPKAHFRWNNGGRYILSDLELQRIETFLGAIFPPDIKYNAKK